MSRRAEEDAAPDRAARRSLRVNIAVGFGIVVLMVAGVGGWAATAKLSGAVMGPGTVVVEGNVKRVQHRDGGIVGEIRVRDGDRVKANELLIRLDDTLTRANLAVVEKQIDQLSARRMRLAAERDGADGLSVPEALADRLADPEIAELVAAEKALFASRRSTLLGQKQQLRERIGQIRQETEGLVARRDAKDDELDLIEQELDGVTRLHEQGLVPFPRLAELARLKAQLAGERGQLVSDMARAAARITETELQILQLDQDLRTEVLTELRDVDGKLAELAEERIAALDKLTRIDIRAPQDGIVHELAVHTVGGVIAPGETIMLIVPDHDALVVEARIAPADIDQIHAGQEAALRFSAFNQRTTPEIAGRVRTVAADVSRNEKTGESWYVARIAIPPAERARLGGQRLVPGMPVETFVQTGERTALSYLMKPLADQIARAMREE
ncbi:HlyD family type I secretion periplasmic adaptor subunit [Kaustia mangrovi]|uniref:HlyD family type I secretion periplasmic adaptor subunit n=1 Tax=Kaustia mangrovi TaxID=2593653 RepID=UPI001FE969FC|nr:HlyD family type I secretion periplasmic adaptor subunit [Kaustia mangrovi]